MAGIFKSLDQSDVRVTPFRTYKLWADHLNYCDYSYQLANNALSIPQQVVTLTDNPQYIYTVDRPNGTIAKLDIRDDYTVLDTDTGDPITAIKTSLDLNHEYIVSADSTTLTRVLDQNLNVVSSAFVVHCLTVNDLSADIANSQLYYCGNGGVGQIHMASGVLGSELGLTAPGYSENYTHINMEGVSVCTSGVTFHTGSNGAYLIDLPYAGNDTQVSVNAPCKKIVYGVSSYYYVLFENNELYRFDPTTGGLVLVLDGVADILEDKNTFSTGSVSVDNTRNLHVICVSGEIYPNFTTTTTGGIVMGEPIDTRRWISLGRTLQASINKNSTGRIGIVGYNTSSLIDTVFYTVDPYTGEIGDPKHFGAINDLFIEGDNLTTFIGLSQTGSVNLIDLDCEYTPVYSVYKADYEPTSNHARTNPLEVLFDQGNRHYQYTEPLTSNGKYQRVVHRSLDNLFYDKFYTNTRATFGSGNINTQFRFLEDQAQIISLPQSKFGESLLPESVKLEVTYYDSQGTQNFLLVDDLYGNLHISGAYTSSYGNVISGSVDATPVGMWPFDNLYRYYQKGPISITSSFNRGTWSMQTAYSNVEFVKLTGSSAPAAAPKDLLGIVPKFSSAQSSSLIVSSTEVAEYDYMYNFENGNFAITMMVCPQGTPNISGSILITKEGPAIDLRTDENANVYTIPANQRSPYRLSLTPDLRIKFERDTNIEVAAVSSSILTLNQLYHVAAIKSGSMIQLYIDGALISSESDVPIPSFCSNKANIYIGNDWKKQRAFDGVIDNIKVYNGTLANSEITLLKETLNVGNGFVGNVFHNHGMITLTSIPARYMDVIDIQARGTHTIWETEISCTINPGEFTRSNNPTMQVYSPEYNQYIFRPFVTGSSFKPYVTTVGLYDNYHCLVAIAKLNTPIQLPDNTDTTIIVRFDR